MADASEFWLQFWGVRGSFPRPGAEVAKYGGNTSCLEVRANGRLLIFDAGTGVYPLGRKLVDDGPVDADLFLTHTHFDHICGLPFFVPAFKAGNRLRIWSGHLDGRHTTEGLIWDLMKEPLYPISPAIFQAELSYPEFDAGDTLEPAPGVTLRTAPLNHPNGATGYRIECAGKAICFITDTEHYEGRRDENVVELIRGADYVIYDATYSDAQYPNYVGWGHSTWEEGVRLMEAAEAGTLVIFHHAPEHDDAHMDAVAEAAEKARPGTMVAREGQRLEP